MYEGKIDVIIRTRNSSDLLTACLDSVFSEIPVRKIIIVDVARAIILWRLPQNITILKFIGSQNLTSERQLSLDLTKRRLSG